jgi:CheY-like chemotaxis protein
MVTALSDGQSILQAYRGKCDGFLGKPIEKAKLLEFLQEFDLVEDGALQSQHPSDDPVELPESSSLA